MKRNFTELKRLARETLDGRYGTPMICLVLTILLPSLILMPFDYLLEGSTLQLVIFYLAEFIIGLLSILLSVGSISIHMNMRRKKTYRVRDLFYFFSHHPDRYMIAYLLLCAIALVINLPAIVVAAFAFYIDSTLYYIVAGVLAVICGIVATCVVYNYAMVFFILLDHRDMKVKAAMKESKQLMKHNRMKLFLLQLSFIGWILLGIGSCAIGFLWIEPYVQQTVISFYFELTGETDRIQAEDSAKGANQDTHFQAYC